MPCNEHEQAIKDLREYSPRSHLMAAPAKINVVVQPSAEYSLLLCWSKEIPTNLISMKKCKHCQADIPKNAKKCKHCTGDLRNWARRHWILTTLGILILIGSISGIGDSPSTSETSRTSTPDSEIVVEAPLEYKLELESSRFYKEYGFVNIEGKVKNISNENIDNIEAVAEFFDKDGNFIKSSSSLIDYNPILADQSSPFRVMTSDNPEIVSGEVTFKGLFGGTVSTKFPED